MSYRSPEQIAVRLAELRKSRDVSQRQLGEAIELDQSAIARMETGERGISVGEMVAICEYLAVAIDELIRDDAPALAFRADASPEAVAEATRAFRKVVDDFFAFEAVAG